MSRKEYVGISRFYFKFGSNLECEVESKVGGLEKLGGIRGIEL